MNVSLESTDDEGAFDLDVGGLKAIYQAEYEINVDDGGKGDTAFSTFGIGVMHNF